MLSFRLCVIFAKSMFKSAQILALRRLFTPVTFTLVSFTLVLAPLFLMDEQHNGRFKNKFR